MYTNIGQ